MRDFLDRYPFAEGYTLPGKKMGRNKNDDAREIAKKVLMEYRVIKDDSSAIPTGQYLFEKINEMINIKALAGEPIPLYGDGANIRDWLYVEDHVDALLLVARKAQIGRSYCVGGHGERSNRQVVEAICDLLDDLKPQAEPHARLITRVKDRPGHDQRYAIDPGRITAELNWQPRHQFADGLKYTVNWYLNNLAWCQSVGYSGNRLGAIK